MSLRGQEFKGILAPTEQRGQPLSEKTKGLNFVVQYARDCFKLITWLCLAALAQGLLFVASGRLALVPPAVLLSVRIVDTLLMANGFKHNSYMDGVVPKKAATAFPDKAGNFGNKPADSELCVFILGTRCNHPLGPLAPGMREIRSFFPNLTAELEKHREEFGFLTSTSWLNADQRQTMSQIMNVCYFKSVEGLHKFAHSAAHREVWNWWNMHVKSMPHLSICHETYAIPKGNWEAIYVNSHITGINAANIKYTDEMTGREMYEYLIVDASRGLLKTSVGRMSRSDATEHDSYGEDPYQDQ